MKRVCQHCGARVRAIPGRWIHDERMHGTRAARAADQDHRVVGVRGTPRPLPQPPQAAAEPTPDRRRRIAPVSVESKPVTWGPPMRFEKWPFNPDRTRLVGCAEAAGTGRIGEL